MSVRRNDRKTCLQLSGSTTEAQLMRNMLLDDVRDDTMDPREKEEAEEARGWAQAVSNEELLCTPIEETLFRLENSHLVLQQDRLRNFSKSAARAPAREHVQALSLC